MGRQRPRSVTNAIRVQAVLVVVSALGPATVPVPARSFIVYALLVWVIASLFGKGHRWARYALGATAVAFVFVMLVIYRADPPGSLAALGAVGVLLNGVLLWLLASRDTS